MMLGSCQRKAFFLAVKCSQYVSAKYDYPKKENSVFAACAWVSKRLHAKTTKKKEEEKKRVLFFFYKGHLRFLVV